MHRLMAMFDVLFIVDCIHLHEMPNITSHQTLSHCMQQRIISSHTRRVKRMSSCWITRRRRRRPARVSQNSLEWLQYVTTLISSSFWRLCMFDKEMKPLRMKTFEVDFGTSLLSCKWRLQSDGWNFAEHTMILISFSYCFIRCHSSCIIGDNRVVDSSSSTCVRLRMQFEMKWHRIILLSAERNKKKGIYILHRRSEPTMNRETLFVDRLIRCLNKNSTRLELKLISFCRGLIITSPSSSHIHDVFLDFSHFHQAQQHVSVMEMQSGSLWFFDIQPIG